LYHNEGFALLLLILSLSLLLSYIITPALQQPALLFQKTWGGSSNDYGYHVAVDRLGNAFVSVLTSSFGLDNPFNASWPVLLKYNSAGNLAWQSLWSKPDNDFSSVGGLAIDNTGNVYLTGMMPGAQGADEAALLLKFNTTTGGLIWQKAWVQPGSLPAGSGVAVYAGNIYVAGTVSRWNGSSIVFLLKFDSTGNLLWNETWGGTGNDVANSVAVDSFGSVYVAGSTWDLGKRDILLLKFNPTGDLISEKALGSSSDDVGYRVVVDDSEGAVYVTGCTYIFRTVVGDGVLLKFDSSGGLLWQRSWTSGVNDCSYGDSVDLRGNIYVAGDTTSSGGVYNAYLMKFSSSGNLEWQKTLFSGSSKYSGSLSWTQPSSGNNNDTVNDLALDSSGNLFITGSVGESPHFTLGVRTYTINSSFSLHPRDLTIGVATLPGYSFDPQGNVSAPLGNETYSGSTDAFLFKFGASSSTYIDTTLVVTILAATPIILLGKRMNGQKTTSSLNP
jgi:beta-propeller repeat-containing protein/beta-propeller uncharacterized protein DUF5122